MHSQASDVAGVGVMNEHQLVIGPATFKAEARNLSFSYGSTRALRNITLPVGQNQITALIGPSGCGKSTFLRCFNRMHDLYVGNGYQGEIILYPDKCNILSPHMDPIEVRMRIGMVFQKPNPFPKSIYENVAYGLRVRGVTSRTALDERVERALRGAALWEEVKDRLDQSGASLSGGQQQRLCIARALATDPEMLLLDEPTSALDLRTEATVVDSLYRLMRGRTTFVVTHRLSLARKASKIIALNPESLTIADSLEELLKNGPLYQEVYDLHQSADAILNLEHPSSR